MCVCGLSCLLGLLCFVFDCLCMVCLFVACILKFLFVCVCWRCRWLFVCVVVLFCVD